MSDILTTGKLIEFATANAIDDDMPCYIVSVSNGLASFDAVDDMAMGIYTALVLYTEGGHAISAGSLLDLADSASPSTQVHVESALGRELKLDDCVLAGKQEIQLGEVELEDGIHLLFDSGQEN